MSPYRKNAIESKKIFGGFGALLCRYGFHKVRVTKVLKGGEGPDEAVAHVICARCNIWGWKYDDGWIGWRGHWNPAGCRNCGSKQHFGCDKGI